LKRFKTYLHEYVIWKNFPGFIFRTLFKRGREERRKKGWRWKERGGKGRWEGEGKGGEMMGSRMEWEGMGRVKRDREERKRGFGPQYVCQVYTYKY
jgi:hypothetical protein